MFMLEVRTCVIEHFYNTVPQRYIFRAMCLHLHRVESSLLPVVLFSIDRKNAPKN